MNVIPDTSKVYYLASPYSTPSLKPVVWDYKEERYRRIEEIALHLMKLDYILIEPIATSHPKSIKYHLPQTFDYWQRRDLSLIDVSHGVIVAGDMKGWNKSTGVRAEIAHAKATGKPVYIYRKERFRRIV